ncbi:hypothetical protein I551_4608 [Mycobacterium ulcerans str. Harvey]|uniref:Uncharacterized protein n=1 Tax=Mycobacterium ulcerans str. Harvey TaxID=1299332 RepID=A0ABP3AGT1_MYCUL|nr:hypothetical protein I551_4608 [Mycobacterium ulcerans str. Harvey]
MDHVARRHLAGRGFDRFSEPDRRLFIRFTLDIRPPAREMAAATPPAWRSWVLAALVIASSSSFVTSAWTTSSSIMGPLSVAHRRKRHQPAGFGQPAATTRTKAEGLPRHGLESDAGRGGR